MRVPIRWPGLMMGLFLVMTGCGGEEGEPTTTPATTTSLPATTSTTTFHIEPIDDDWAPVDVEWAVAPSCCDLPAIGPISPEGPIPAEGWPADGFYDVTVTRPGDPPGVLHLAIRRWVSCSDLPHRCPLPDPPQDGIVGDPATEVEKVISMSELTVMIRPLQTSINGGFSDPAVGITGSGSALLELLTGFCSGSLPSPFPVNCGVDHAFVDWIWEPYLEGSSLDEIVMEIIDRQDDPAFPLARFDDGSSEIPCSENRACPIAYRGPRGTHLVMSPELVESAEEWPGVEMYGWWASLEIRDGLPILYIDAGQVAG